jgi:hypothetical protein
MCGCRAQPSQVPAAQTATTSASPVLLPDISGAAPEVQAQVRQQYSSLQDTISRGRPANEVAEAYAAM